MVLEKIRGLLVKPFHRQGGNLQHQLHNPPMPPQGYEIRPPDFIGLGAQKCGTTWWHELIKNHPKIYDFSHLRGKVTPAWLIKERHFFDSFYDQQYSESDTLRYAKWMAKPVGTISGEWTPRYLSMHWAPSLIKKAAPNACFLVMLRDPVDRFVSGMRHVLRSRSIHCIDAQEHYYRGLYCHQLRMWLSVFKRSQFLILQYERCLLEPDRQLQRTFEFLGLDPISTRSIDFKTRKNVTRNKESYTLDENHRRSLVDSYHDDVKDLLRDFPEIDVHLWKHFDT